MFHWCDGIARNQGRNHAAIFSILAPIASFNVFHVFINVFIQISWYSIVSVIHRTRYVERKFKTKKMSEVWWKTVFKLTDFWKSKKLTKKQMNSVKMFLLYKVKVKIFQLKLIFNCSRNINFILFIHKMYGTIRNPIKRHMYIYSPCCLYIDLKKKLAVGRKE